MPGFRSWIQKIFGVEETPPIAESTLEITIPAQPAQAELDSPMIAPEMDKRLPLIEEGLPKEDDAVERRARQAIESLLENESLTSELDDSAAKHLLAWGMAGARQVAAATAGLDDADAEARMMPRLRELRLMLSAVNHWVGRSAVTEAQAGDHVLQQILKSASAVYGDGFTPPTAEQIQLILREMAQVSSPAEQRIASLHRGLDPHA